MLLIFEGIYIAKLEENGQMLYLLSILFRNIDLKIKTFAGNTFGGFSGLHHS